MAVAVVVVLEPGPVLRGQVPLFFIFPDAAGVEVAVGPDVLDLPISLELLVQRVEARVQYKHVRTLARDLEGVVAVQCAVDPIQIPGLALVVALAPPLVIPPERVDVVEAPTGVGAVYYLMRPGDAADSLVGLERRDLGLSRLDDEASERREVADVIRFPAPFCRDIISVMLGAQGDDVLGPRLGVGRGGVVE